MINLPSENIHAEGWILLKYDDPVNGIYYKIFASWRDGDSWRLSSGCQLTELIRCGETLKWPQMSGSTYIFDKKDEDGYTFYTGHQMNTIIGSSGFDGIKIELVKFESELKLHAITMKVE
jgi:hypothetical protein